MPHAPTQPPIVGVYRATGQPLTEADYGEAWAAMRRQEARQQQAEPAIPYGLSGKQRAALNRKRRMAVLRLRNRGAEPKDVADRLGVDLPRVYRDTTWLRINGFSI